MTELSWVRDARKHLGQAETPGPVSNEWIRDVWLGLPGGKWYWETYGRDDSKLPWCGAFVAMVMQGRDIAIPSSYASARAWLQWGSVLERPQVGCVVVFGRQGGGHVGIVVGVDARGWLLVLGGNQADAVSIAAFDPARAEGYRWPPLMPRPEYDPLPLATAPRSTSEA